MICVNAKIQEGDSEIPIDLKEDSTRAEVSENCPYVFRDCHVLRTCFILAVNVKIVLCLYFTLSCRKSPVKSPNLILLGIRPVPEQSLLP